MKKALLFLLISILLLTGCSQGITLDNIDDYEITEKYSKVSMGKIKKCSEDLIITEIKEFVNMFLSAKYNRSYKDNKTLENETIMYSESFLETNSQKIEEEFLFNKEFYKEYEISTELLNVEFKNIVNVNGDAYVNCEAKVNLSSCNDQKVAKIMGFDGNNSKTTSKYTIKLKYSDRAYTVYDYQIIKEDGYLLAFSDYQKRIEDSMSDEEKLERLALMLSKAQNDRVYYEFSGDEDYKYLTEECIKNINKDRDNAKYTKELYIQYKLSTKLEKCDVVNIAKTSEGYTIKVKIYVKMLECYSNEVAKKLGFTDGIGSTRKMDYEYYVVEENGEFKVDSTKFLG